MVPITWCFSHYMVSLPGAVKAGTEKCGSEKTDYRTQRRHFAGSIDWDQLGSTGICPARLSVKSSGLLLLRA
jgi:hypothetical protein